MHRASTNLSDQVTLAVLAGGAGERMGYPKGQLQIRGKPILQYLLDRFAWPGPTMLVTAPGREHPPASDRFDLEVVDPIAGQGPLRGVLTALENCSTASCVITTVDMPGIDGKQLRVLLARLEADSSLLGVMFQRIERDEVKIEPFPLACRIAASSVMIRQLTEQRRSVRGLLKLPGFIAEPTPVAWDKKLWANLNRPEDLLSFET